jgi:hypothetical protein
LRGEERGEAKMKKTSFFLLSFLLVFCLVGRYSPAAQRLMTVKVGKDGAAVSFIEGTSHVLPQDVAEWRPLKLGETLRVGDEISTGTKSKLEIVMADKSALRFADNSYFKIVKIEAQEEVKTEEVRVRITLGRVWANVSKAMTGKKRKFELTCENAVVGVRDTVYRMNVEDDKSALVRVYDGTVFVAGGGQAVEPSKVIGPPEPVAGPKPIPGPRKVTMEEWTYIIKTMQQIRIGADGTAEKPRDFTEAEDRDEWVDWNRSMDAESRERGST